MFAASKSGKAAAAAAATDPYFPYVPLLLNTTSTNGQQNNTFLDSSSNAFTITRNGTPTQGAFTPYQPSGYWSGYFSGTGDYLTAPSNSAFAFGTNDFTIECWVYLNASKAQAIVDTRSSGPSANGIAVAIDSSNFPYIYVNGTTLFTSSTALSNNVWNHLAVVKSSNVITLYINGVKPSTGSGTSTTNLTDTSLTIAGIIDARDATATYKLNGYASNVRLVKGVAVYTGAFTPPTAPLAATQSAGTNISAITGTQCSLLACSSNRFIDIGGQVTPNVITVNGTPKVQAFQPFSPAASYSAATYGGSGYFGATSNYLSTPDATAFNLSGGSWTIECWIYPNGTYTDFNNIVLKRGALTAWQLYLNQTTGYLSFFNLTSAYNSTSTPIANAWNHIAAVYDGTNINLYLNGTRVLQSATGNTDFSAPIYVGAFATQYQYLGYISNVRIVKGTAIYSGATYTVPTSPLTAVSGTSLLTNFTNAGIYDAAWQNNALTVGDAQVSTTQAKWPTTSMKFDGTGDIVSCPANQGFVFTGDLTIEGWVWIDSTMASSRPDNLKVFIFTGWNTGNTPQFFVNGTTSTPGTGLGYYDGTTAYTATVTVPKDQWVYLAFVRSGSAIYGYVNGTQYTITSSYSSTIGSLNTFVIGGNPNQSAAYYSYLKGYIQDLRITKGVARTITTPTAAFPTR